MFKVRALSRLHGDKIPEGHQRRGNTFEVDRDFAFELAKNGSVEILEGDDTGPNFEQKEGGPSSSATTGAPSLSSQAGSPPAPLISPSSPAGQSSQSATGTDSAGKPSLFTRLTGGGGKSTTKKSARVAKATDGARTAKRVGTLTSSGSNPSDPPASLADVAASTPGK